MASRSIGVNDNNVITFTAIVVEDGMGSGGSPHTNNSSQSKRFQEQLRLAKSLLANLMLGKINIF